MAHLKDVLDEVVASRNERVLSAVVMRLSGIDRRLDSQDRALEGISGTLAARKLQSDADREERALREKHRDRNMAFAAAIIVGFVPVLTKIVDMLMKGWLK